MTVAVTKRTGAYVVATSAPPGPDRFQHLIGLADHPVGTRARRQHRIIYLDTQIADRPRAQGNDRLPTFLSCLAIRAHQHTIVIAGRADAVFRANARQQAVMRCYPSVAPTSWPTALKTVSNRAAVGAPPRV
ncbi:hypothetical protein AA103196_2598 [Ameyamaea chiangmaiensis NBRC 103196]|nr:hypothetical protein AA103196_2598 [Ameyamaea chiangmaiensis NBRC 103196]